MSPKQGALIALPPVLVFVLWGMQNSWQGTPSTTGTTSTTNTTSEFVSSVIDGDTFKIGTRRIRLWGIDAPEHKQKCYSGETFWLCGEEAKQALEKKIVGGAISCETLGMDGFRRELAKCFVGGLDVGAYMVESGWAIDWPQYSKGYYAAQQKAAREQRLGIHRS